MNPVTVTDVADLWRAMTDAEKRRCELKLSAAWAELKRRVPGFLARVNSGDIEQDILFKVISEAVEEVMRNPEKYIEVSVDDFRGRRGESGSKSKNLFSDEDLELLAPAKSDQGSFSIVLGWS